MGYAITQAITLETIDCCTCGIVFAMPDTMVRRMQATGGLFYCSNGHAQSYTTSEGQRLREKLDEQTRASTHMAERAKQAEAAEQKAVREIKRLNKRSAAGVCPCCNRTFQQLARHMKAKHAEFGNG